MFLAMARRISRQTAENPKYPNNPAQHLPGLCIMGAVVRVGRVFAPQLIIA